MDKEFSYALIPVVMLEILTLFWIIIIKVCFFIKFKYRKKFGTISVSELSKKMINNSEYKISIEYAKMLGKYKYSYKKSLIKMNTKIKSSNLILDLLIPIKAFNDVDWENTLYNGEYVFFNVSKILNIIKYFIIIPLVFNVFAVIFLIIASQNDSVAMYDLVKVFSLLSLTTFLLMWFTWVFYYNKYLHEVNITIAKYFNENEIAIFIKLLKCNYISLGIK